MALFTPQNIPQYNGNDLQGTVQQLLTAYKALTEQLTYVLQNIDDDNGAASSGDVAELNDKMIAAVSNASNAFSNASAALEAAQNAYQTAERARNTSEQAEATAEAAQQGVSAAQSAAASAQTAAENAQISAKKAADSAEAASQAVAIPLSDSVSLNSSTTAASSAAVKLAYDRTMALLHRSIIRFNDVQIPHFGYVRLGHMSDFGLDPALDYIMSATIRGWAAGSTGKGALSVAKGSDGETLYAFGSDECTFTWVIVEIWSTKYPDFNS